MAVGLGRDLSYDEARRIWVEADGSSHVDGSDGSETELSVQRAILGALDVRVGSKELEVAAREHAARYHLSAARANLLRPLSWALRGRVLEIGAGYGALTRYLGENGGSVVALEGHRQRAAVCRSRCRDLDNVEVVCADATQGLPSEAYDALVLVGGLEQSDPLDFLRLCGSALDPDGVLVLAVDNRLSRESLAGGPEHRFGVVPAFGRAELDRLLRGAGFDHREFFYPFPDHRLPRVVLSEAAFEEAPLVIADLLTRQEAESPAPAHARALRGESAWPSLVRNGLGPDLSHAFLVVASRTRTPWPRHRSLAYVYSTDRRRCFQKEAVLERDAGGGIVARRGRLYPDRDVPAAPYVQRVEDSRYVDGVVWGTRIDAIVNRDGWTIAQIADWARPWVDVLVTRTETDEGGAGLGERMLSPGAIDCTPCNLVRTPEGTLVPVDQEWEAASRVPLGYVVFRGLLSTLLRIRSTAAPADTALETIGSVVAAVMRALGVRADDATLDQFARAETRFQEWVTGERQDTRPRLASPMPPVRVPWAVDAGAELARLRRELDLLVASGRAEILARDETILALQGQLAEQTAWAQASAAAVAERDRTIGALQTSLNDHSRWTQDSTAALAQRGESLARLRNALEAQAERARAELSRREADIAALQASLDEQTRRADASAAEVSRRDTMLAELQASLDVQTRWAHASASEVAHRDTVIRDLQAALEVQSRWARENNERVAEGDRIISELTGRLEESRLALGEVAREDKAEFLRLAREHARRSATLEEGLDSVRRQLDEVLALSRRSVLDRLLRSVSPSAPRIDVLHPSWTEVGRGFNSQGDGRTYLAVEGAGFGDHAIVVIGGWPMETVRASDRLLSAYVPDELLARAAVLPIWVDNRDEARSLSRIRRFRVMSPRTVAAYRPASGRCRRLKDLVNVLLWLASVLASRMRVPRFYVDRALGARRPVPAAGPWIDALYPAWTQAGKAFNPQQDGRASLGVRGSGFGDEAVVVIAGWPVETFRASGRLLTASIPDELFARPGVLPVWVDNRDAAHRLSPIRRFRVMSARMVAAYRLRGVADWCLWMIAGVWARMQTPRLYLRRARGKRWSRFTTVPALQHRRTPAPTVEMLAAHLVPARLPRKPDIVCFSIIDWDFRYQRPQQLLGRLVETGHRVFYLSQRFLGAGHETFRLRPLAPGVTEVFLQASPSLNIYKDALGGEIEETLYAALLDFKAAAGLGETVCFVQLPFWTPLVLRLRADLGYRIVFDCLDDFSGFQNIGNRMMDLERTLAARADLVVVSSSMLADKHAAHEPLLVPNAADYDHFATAMVSARRTPDAGLVRRGYEALAHWLDLAVRRLNPRAPVLGYYGAIAHWFDADLIARAAAARPDWRFVLIGRTDPEVRAQLAGLANVRLVGEMPYEQLPSQLATFDVCLIPFVVDDLIKATSPVKFFEYLAAGKPVVAARMPELLPFSGECFLYDGLSEFLPQIERALAGQHDPDRVAARRAVARANTWERRVEVLDRAFDGLYPRASVIVVTYNGLDLTRACVDSLLEKTAYADWELLVVDNASTDGTPAYLRALAERAPFVRIVLNESNRGFAAANNQGIQLSTGQFVILLNNDTVVTQGWLGRLLRHLDDAGVGLVGPVTNTVGNEAQVETSYGGDLAAMEEFAERYTRARTGRVFDIPMLAMFCVAMPRWLLDKVGMLDERYQVGMFEDDDFTRSVKARGYRVVCAEDVFIHHVGGAAFKRLAPETYRQIFEANRQRYEEKWGEPWVPHRSRA